MTVPHRYSIFPAACALVVLLVAMLMTTSAAAAAVAQRSFATPEEAVNALVQAVKRGDRNAVLATLGDAGEWLSSGDAVADRETVERFVTAFDEGHKIAADGDMATLMIGTEAFPFAFPLLRSGNAWRFDTAAGKEELLARRIGRNELSAVEVLRAIVDAQYEYAAEDRSGQGVHTYAQRFASRPGKRDGLYWPVKTGEPESPLGVLVAQAAHEGYTQGEKSPTPFYGYRYNMLKGQGANARSGAFDYVVRGRAIGGFAVVAYPARYGNSGIMTFMVNQDGEVYQADLGPQTRTKVEAMQRFDPGKGWMPVGK
jgi:hypothetical protein